MEFVNQLKHANNGFPKGASLPLVGFLGATPLNRRSQAAKYPTCANVLQSKTWKQKLAFVFRSAACEALRKSEFFGGKPKKRKSLQERNFLTAALLLLSYSDKGKLRPKRSTGTFWRNIFSVNHTRRGVRGRPSSETCRFPYLPLRFGRKGEFRPLRRATMGRCPLDPHQRVRTPFGNPRLGETTAR